MKSISNYLTLFLAFISSYSIAQVSVSVTNYADVSCALGSDGAISVQASGGQTPYTYLWDNAMMGENINGLISGTYTVTAIDNNLVNDIISVTISEPMPLQLQMFPIDDMCPGICLGEIWSTVNGGTPGYTYQWDDPMSQIGSSATGLCFGVYILTVTDANGCVTVSPATFVNEPIPVSVSVSNIVNSTCGQCDGSATINVAGGGTAPYTFSWSNGSTTPSQSGLCAGTYTIDVYDANGCFASTQVTIMDNGATFNITATALDDTCGACIGEVTINVGSGGTAPYFYEWGNGNTTGFTNSTSETQLGYCGGNYIVQVTDSMGCTITDTIDVQIYQPSISLNIATTLANCGVCDGSANITPTGGTGTFDYIWSNLGSTAQLSGLCGGTYTVTATDMYGCSVDSVVTINSTSGLSGSVTVSNASCNGWIDGNVTAIPSGGTTPYSIIWSNGAIGTIATGLGAGVYYTTITDASGCTFSSAGTVNQPTLLVPVSNTIGTCDSIGSIVFTATGGTIPYQYSIDSGSTWSSTSVYDSLNFGLYIGAVQDANGCINYDSILVDSTSILIAQTVYQSNSCGQYGYAQLAPFGGSTPYSFNWNPATAYNYVGGNGIFYNTLYPGNYSITVTDASGCSSQLNVNINNLCLPNIVRGNVYDDLSADCVKDVSEGNLMSKTVVATPGPYYATTDYQGNYQFYLDSGDYTISIIDDEPARDPLCPSSVSYDLQLGSSDSLITDLDFAFQPTAICSELEVYFSHLGFRPCFSSWYRVYYNNNGTDTANNAYIEVTLPTEVTPVAVASWGPYWNQAPYNSTQPDSQNGNTYTYLLGDIPPNTGGNYYILIDISCDAQMGQTLCAEAHIFPDNGCTPIDSLWDRSSIMVEAECSSDSLACFTIYNTGDAGNGDMDAPSEYRIYENNVLVHVGTFHIAGGDSIEICYSAAGNTIRLEADQRPGHPGNSHPNDVVELCGNPNQLTGLVTSMPLDDDDSQIDIVCVPVTSSWDPNDKQVTPSGITEEYHFIDSLTTLDYKIRFQNTGTDTAFNIYVVDTISPYLDPLSIQLGASSHNYTFDFLDSNVVQWCFPWIMLVDSNVNEPASHGFFNFTIKQRPGNAAGTVIENSAGIYFDFNEPVITNTAFNTVGIPDTFTTIASAPIIYNEMTEVKVYPNPFNLSTTFEINGVEDNLVLSVFDLTGKQITTIQGKNKLILERGDMKTGIYFYSISTKQGIISKGKIIVQ